jgi:23S rRNA (uracil1939-C5)-methyltransferase
MPDVPYAAQLGRKHAWLTGLMRQALGPRTPTILPVAGMHTSGEEGPRGFRHKVSFVFGPGAPGGPLVMGHYAAGSNRVVPIADCPVHSARGNRIAFAVRNALVTARVPAAGPGLDGLVRHIIVRTTADERQAVAMLVVTRNDKRLRVPVKAVMSGPDAPDGFVINIHDRPGPYMIGRESLVVAGRGQVRDTRLGVAHLISPMAFFQTNVDAAARLLDEVMSAIPAKPSRRVLDLYSGSGLFGLPLARAGHRVTMVEENAQAIADAEANVRTNRMDGASVRPICARAEAFIARETGRADRSRDRLFDVVVLDPPREGCPPEVIRGVFEGIRPSRAVYVSCNPEALVSELPDILAAGYRITRVLPVDMFPHTDHVETVVTIEDARLAPGSRPTAKAQGFTQRGSVTA